MSLKLRKEQEVVPHISPFLSDVRLIRCCGYLRVSELPACLRAGGRVRRCGRR